MRDFAYPGTELEALAEAKNYYEWIVDEFRPFLGAAVAEVGAGIGTFAERLVAEAGVRRLELFEPDHGLVEALQARFAGNERVVVVRGAFDPERVAGPVDAIVLVNVLEHIADDSGFVRDAFAALRPGGALLLFVPALPWLFGSLDRAFEHARRYTRGSMRSLLQGGGFRIERLRYMNLLGIASWLVAGRLLRMTTISPASIRLYDRWVIPVVSQIERRLSPPLGQNLLAIAVRPD